MFMKVCPFCRAKLDSVLVVELKLMARCHYCGVCRLRWDSEGRISVERNMVVMNVDCVKTWRLSRVPEGCLLVREDVCW